MSRRTHHDARGMLQGGRSRGVVFNPKVKRLLDVTLERTLPRESGAGNVCSVRFSADGKFLATGCNRSAHIYDTKTGAKTCILAHDTAQQSGDMYVQSVCFSPDGHHLATGAQDKRIRFWNIMEKRVVIIFDGHQDEITSLTFSHDGRLIVSGSSDNTVRIWDTSDGSSKILATHHSGTEAGVNSVVISPNGEFVAAGTTDRDVRIWDVASGSLLECLKGHRESVSSVTFTTDGTGLITGSLDKTLKHWDVRSLLSKGVAQSKEPQASQCTMSFVGQMDYVFSVAVSSDKRWVMSGGTDGNARLWNSQDGTLQCELQGHTAFINSVDASPTGTLLATGGMDGEARIWNMYNKPAEATAPKRLPEQRAPDDINDDDSLLDLPAVLHQQSALPAVSRTTSLSSFFSSIDSAPVDPPVLSEPQRDAIITTARKGGIFRRFRARFRRSRTRGNESMYLRDIPHFRNRRAGTQDVAGARAPQRLHAAGHNSPVRRPSEDYDTDADSDPSPVGSNSDLSYHGLLETICFCLCIKLPRDR
ncbi:WD40 repeat-like protein [Leucogyrophana mollusca]|uniref:WD40 repeat-like protein n=1 Tax=Leucogyrophana mollusca TaxID=85980 RepID=A0ACB8BPN4_9AGAM|nr:WD40 repeat-like protein [Leucogyrophana mollusca]